MRKALYQSGAALLLAAWIAALPAHALAQTNQKSAPGKAPAAEKASKTEKKRTNGPFYGKLAAIDQNTRAITVGKRTFFITSDTKFFKAGKPSTLSEGVVGEIASGGYKIAENGNLIATKVNFGPKMDSPDASPKKDTPKK